MRLAVIGAGNVGGSLGKALVAKGFDVTFYDVSQNQLKKIGDYKLTMLFDDVLQSDVTFICVPTEAKKDGSGACDMTIFDEVINQLKAGGFKGLTVQVSTCPPFTAREASKILPNYVVCPSHYQMSRMDEDALHPVRINIGTYDGEPNAVMSEIFSRFGAPMRFMSYEQTELTKYVENVLAATVISYWNEVFLLCEKLKDDGYDVDSDEMARIINDAPCWRSIYRFHGRAYGGLCLNKDTRAFIDWCIKRVNFVPMFSEAADCINQRMKDKYGVNERHSNYAV